MIVIQRVRVRWSAAARGAPDANARRGLDGPVMLPVSMPTGDVVIQEVLADHAVGYRRRDEVLAGGLDRARDLGLWLSAEDSAMTVERLPGWAAYPHQRGMARLFTLLPGQVGQYRANFRSRFTECACNPSWFYESWLVHISNGLVKPDRFTRGAPDHAVDDRVHLYGGTGRPMGRSRGRRGLRPT